MGVERKSYMYLKGNGCCNWSFSYFVIRCNEMIAVDLFHSYAVKPDFHEEKH